MYVYIFRSKVKFWFLKNYLSPTLKDILPEMAKEYGLEYELVQYHWPRWVSTCTKKGSINLICSHIEIPFITISSTHKEKSSASFGATKSFSSTSSSPSPSRRLSLWMLTKLFVPTWRNCSTWTWMGTLTATPRSATRARKWKVSAFGSMATGSRTWVAGSTTFRHCKTTRILIIHSAHHFKSYCLMTPIMLSCRYVIDLLRFRRIAAGDRLRGQYQALSQDPNSLSNLDQVCAHGTHSLNSWSLC